MPNFVSLNGPDNVGKTTQLRRLAEHWSGFQSLGAVHEHDPEPWARVAAEDYATWWFETSTTMELTEMLLAGHARRAAAHEAGRTGLLDYLTTERHDRQRGETADVTARLFAALISSDEGARAVLLAMPEVFPWTRHLSAEEVREFVVDIVKATHDAVELDVHSNLHRVIVEWRATARILADPDLAAQLTTPLPDEDHGEVPVP